MKWNPQQGEDIMELGSWLSLILHCPVRYPAHNKNIFECKCGILFPVFVVKGKDMERIKRIHKGESNVREWE